MSTGHHTHSRVNQGGSTEYNMNNEVSGFGHNFSSVGAREAIEILLGANIEELIPGPFVVMQGIPGDGMANTIDSMPELIDELYDDNLREAGEEVIADDDDGTTGSLSLSIPSDLPNEIPNLSSTSANSSHISSMKANVNNVTHVKTDQNLEGSKHGSNHELVGVGETITTDVSSCDAANVDGGDENATALPFDNSSVCNADSSSSFQARTQIDRGIHLPLPASAVNVTAMGIRYNSYFPPVSTSQSTSKQIKRNGAANLAAKSDDANNMIDIVESFILVDGKNDDENDNDNNLGESPCKTPMQNSVSSFENQSSDIDIGRSASFSQNLRYKSIPPLDRKAIQQWKISCRKDEKLKRDDMLENLSASSVHDLYSRQCHWWTTNNGCLAVFESLPVLSATKSGTNVSNDHNNQNIILTDLGNEIKIGPICSEIPPGTTVLATEIHHINESLIRAQLLESKQRDKVLSHYQLLRIESPVDGYIVYSFNGLCYLGPGLPSVYIEPEVWGWRVTCPNGAFVRQGLELTSVHTDTIPYGSVVRVTRKTINTMGLSRLQIESSVPVEPAKLTNTTNKMLSRTTKNDEDQSPRLRRVYGWVSEALNPLSGQRGKIVEPIPFPVPALYRVTLIEGAVIRSGIELSSPQIGYAQIGTILTIVGRGFSEHPADKCLERLKLAGGGGWISVRLNRTPPLDHLIVELVGIDGTFEPHDAGLYHIEKQRQVLQECMNAQYETEAQNIDNIRRSLHRLSTISAINDDDDEDQSTKEREGESLENYGDVSKSRTRSSLTSAAVPTLYRSGVGTGSDGSQSVKACGSKSQKNEHCLICLSEARTATIVHGETGHVACCLTCARILKARGDKCPVCRLPIDSIIQQFWA